MNGSSPSLDVDGCVELAVLERSGLIESRHIGAAVVMASGGRVLRALGDIDASVYPRSSLKFFQAIAVMRSGVDLADAQAVLATASHGGTKRHVGVVNELLARASVTEDALQCPADWPLDTEARADARITGEGARRITMNCSGKHAAFLLACQTNGWPLDTYLNVDHPLQNLIRATIEEFTGETVRHTGVDGCGAPVHAVSLRALARGVSRVASADPADSVKSVDGAPVGSSDTEAATLRTAILENPWAIDGDGRANTVVTERLGIIAKLGAEGVLVLGTADGTAVALKVLDGNMRASTLIGLELLVSVGALDGTLASEVIAATTEAILGGGTPVGELRASDAVTAGVEAPSSQALRLDQA